MIVYNKTTRRQVIFLEEYVLNLEPMGMQTLYGPQDEKARMFFRTETGKILLDNGVLEWAEIQKKKPTSPTELPSPEAPEHLKTAALSSDNKVGVSTKPTIAGTVPLPK